MEKTKSHRGKKAILEDSRSVYLFASPRAAVAVIVDQVIKPGTMGSAHSRIGGGDHHYEWDRRYIANAISNGF
jgi:hypothetical protein